MMGRPWPRPVSIAVFLVALLVAGGLSQLASEAPDGLEKVAMDLHFEEAAREPALEVMPDYEPPGMGAWGVTVAGFLGTFAVGGLLLLTGMLIQGGRRGREPAV